MTDHSVIAKECCNEGFLMIKTIIDMAKGKKISELELLEEIQGNEEIAVARGGQNYKMTFTQIKNNLDNASTELQNTLDELKKMIPNQASESNQLADKDFVNSSIATNTATFKGTYQSESDLDDVEADANDYVFVESVDEDGNTLYKRYKYSEDEGWLFEYELNNSSFTSSQWKVLNSEITKDMIQDMKTSIAEFSDTYVKKGGDTMAGNLTAPRFISTQATGTPPFSVESKTVVPNLNASLLEGNSSLWHRNNTLMFSVVKQAKADDPINPDTDLAGGGVLRNYYGLTGWGNTSPSGVSPYGQILALSVFGYSEALSAQLAWDSNGKLWFRIHNGSKFTDWREFTFTDSNVNPSVNYDEEFLSYGIEYDTASSSPECTRIGNMSYHRTLPVQSGMRGCLLDDEGNVIEYLPSNDWTTAVRDGSKGQVMVEIPEHYRKFEEEGTKQRVRLSTMPLAGFHRVPKQYVSAYQASLDRTNNKLASVVNVTAQYRGGNNTAAWDDTYRSLLGRPVTNLSRTNFRTYARNRKADSVEWNCMTYGIHKTLYWLFVVEYATLNSQKAYNAAVTAEGYRQGGLGDGVSNLADASWSAFNSYNPFIPCGYTDSIGNGTGIVPFTMPSEYGSALVTNVPRYRGVENPFAHIWQWTDGINVRIDPDVSAGGDGLSKVYVTDNPSLFNDNNYDGYKYVGDEARTNGYVMSVIFGEGGEIICKSIGAGSTSYFTDYHYTNIPTARTLRGVLFGAGATSGAYAGFVFSYSHYAPSNANANVGSRLCFIPA